MALAERADLVARLSLEGNFASGIAGARRQLGGLTSALNSPRLRNAGTQLGTGIRNSAAIAAGGIALLTTQVAAGLSSLVELERLGAQTGAVLKSTGSVAGVTANDVRRLAEQYESLNATIDDKVIQNTENLLLTFTSIRKDAFEPTLAAILDMNAALGGGEGGLQSVTIQVGKALQDPIRGLTALRRVGVNFTKAQEKQIKALVEAGDAMGAQKVILAELNREFGGSFLAQGDTTAGKVAKFKDAIEDLQKSLATALLPALGRVADKLSTFLADPKVIAAVGTLGDKIAGLFTEENFEKGAAAIGEAFTLVRDALPGLKDAASITGEILGTAVSLFKSLPPDLQRLAIGALAVNKLTGGLVTNVAGGLAGLLLRNLTTVNAAHVTVVGGTVTGVGGGVAGTAAAAGGVASVVRTVSQVALPIAAFTAIGEAIRGAVGINGDALIQAMQDAQTKETAAIDKVAAKFGGMALDDRELRSSVDRVYDSIERKRLAVTVNVTTSVTSRSVAGATFRSRTYSSSFLNRPL